jgi:DNA-binding winged helix-turn-helix (wHTH) protein/TolB-like protein
LVDHRGGRRSFRGLDHSRREGGGVSRIVFGPFAADPVSGELRRDGVVVPLQDLPFRLLAALLERPGELVPRAELSAKLWGSETFVDATSGLNTAVAKLREALGDNAETPLYIETVPKRGYRFIGTIGPADVEAPEQRVDAIKTGNASSRRPLMLAIAAAAILAVVAAATYQLRATPEPVRVAVILFDNETGDPSYTPLSQGLTDAVVTELTADARLAVIGNAAVLRTARPFRDIAKVRDAVAADYIIIGQVQQLDGGTIVRTHLIRARDEAHVWVTALPREGRTEAAFQSAVAAAVRAAVAQRVFSQSSAQ